MAEIFRKLFGIEQKYLSSIQVTPEKLNQIFIDWFLIWNVLSNYNQYHLHFTGDNLKRVLGYLETEFVEEKLVRSVSFVWIYAIFKEL